MDRLVGALAVACALSMAAPVSAAVVTSLPGGVAQPMPDRGPAAFDPGPHTFGDGITWSAPIAGWFGMTGANFGFGANGNWFGPPMAATDNAPYTAMQFAFAAPVAGFLAQVNWSDTSPASSITSYDADDNVLDVIQLSAAGVNLETPDGYYGFRESTASISRVVFSGLYTGARDISVLAAVPELGAWTLMLLGFLGAGAMLRRRRPRAAAA